jgi:hypothetical protein
MMAFSIKEFYIHFATKSQRLKDPQRILLVLLRALVALWLSY